MVKLMSVGVGVATVAVGLLLAGQAGAGAERPVAPDRKRLGAVAAKAVAYLRQQGQAEDGSFSKHLGPGITAIVLTGVLQTHQASPREPWVERGLKYLESFVKPDGGINAGRHDNYTTSVCLMAFHAANVGGRYDRVIAAAQKHLKRIQWDRQEGYSPDSHFYGGFGYGSHKRPDMSNTQFAIEALRSSGVPADDPAVQRALVFLSRSQNLYSEFNRLPFAAKAAAEDRGGFIYTPVGDGESKAGSSPTGGLRSYGSMTYAGLKSMIYAGLSRDDPRVKAAVSWLRRHWTLKENPGVGQQGLYYYYHTMAKALDALGEDPFVDAAGDKHHWRVELFEELAKRQQPDGSWVNAADRWYEGDPNLVTGYVLMALSHLGGRR